MNKKLLLLALAGTASIEIYGAQAPDLQYPDLHLPSVPQGMPQQISSSNYPLLHGWPAPQSVQPGQNYYDQNNPYLSQAQQTVGTPVYFMPPTSLAQYPAIYQITQQPQGERPTAPPLSTEEQAQFAQESGQAITAHNHAKPHHDDVIKHQVLLPVEMAAGYGMGLLMSDEILGFLQKLGFKKEVKADIEKLRKKRAWYIPALLVAAYIAYKFGPTRETSKFVQCACDQRGFHEITRVSIFDRLGNAALGYAVGLVMPHLESQPAGSKKSNDKPASAKRISP